jgi:hypothetical protein
VGYEVRGRAWSAAKKSLVKQTAGSTEGKRNHNSSARDWPARNSFPSNTHLAYTHLKEPPQLLSLQPHIWICIGRTFDASISLLQIIFNWVSQHHRLHFQAAASPLLYSYTKQPSSFHL